VAPHNPLIKRSIKPEIGRLLNDRTGLELKLGSSILFGQVESKRAMDSIVVIDNVQTVETLNLYQRRSGVVVKVFIDLCLGLERLVASRSIAQLLEAHFGMEVGKHFMFECP
jgi:hypothetical protein